MLMTLFTDQLKTDSLAYLGRRLPSFLATLAVSEGDDWQAARNQLDRWVQMFPVGAKREQLVQNLLQFDHQHLSAMFEFVTYYVCKESGIDIQPNNGDLAEYPDFFIDIGQSKTKACLEVTTFQPDTPEHGSISFFDRLRRAVEKKLTLPILVSISIRNLRREPDSRMIKNIGIDLSRQINSIDNPDSLTYLERIAEYKKDNIEVVADYVQGEPSPGVLIGSIGGMYDLRSQHKKFQSIIKRKIQRHRQVYPDKPLVLSISVCSLAYPLVIAIWRASNPLYGMEGLQSFVTPESHANSPRSIIDTSTGLITPKIINCKSDNPRYCDLSGVLDISRIGLSDEGWKFSIAYTPNIWAKCPLFEFSEGIPNRILSAHSKIDNCGYSFTPSDPGVGYITTLH
jgi:hypothetical protein